MAKPKKSDKISVRTARLMREKSQREMAEKLGVCLNTYIYKESGKCAFSVKEAMKVCDILGVGFEQIDWTAPLGKKAKVS